MVTNLLYVDATYLKIQSHLERKYLSLMTMVKCAKDVCILNFINKLDINFSNYSTNHQYPVVGIFMRKWRIEYVNICT